MKFQLRFQQPPGWGVRGQEDEVRILAAAWIELQRATDIGAQATVALYRTGQPHQRFDFARKILLARRVHPVIEQGASESLEFRKKARQQPASPLVVRHQGHTPSMSVTQSALRRGNGLVFRRQRKLVEARRRQGFVGQVIQRQYRDGHQDIVGQFVDVLLQQRSDHELGAVLDRGRIGSGGPALGIDVVNTHTLAVIETRGGGEIGAEETILHCRAGGGCTAGQRQQQCDLPRVFEQQVFRDVEIAEDRQGRMPGVLLAPAQHAVAPADALSTRRSGERADGQPAAYDRIVDGVDGAAQYLRAAGQQALPEPQTVLLDVPPVFDPHLSLDHQFDSARRILFLNPGIGPQGFDAQPIPTAETLPAQWLEQRQGGIGLAVIKVQGGPTGRPQADEATRGRLRDATKRAACARDVAGIEILLDGQQGVTIAFATDGDRGQAHVGAGGFGMVTIACESSGAAFGRTGEAAYAGRVTRGEHEGGREQQGNACQRMSFACRMSEHTLHIVHTGLQPR